MTRLVSSALLVALLAPCGLAGQVSLAPRIGTLGLGADVGVGLGGWGAFRAGLGLFPTELEGDFSDIRYQAEIPDNLTAGLELHVWGGFRIGGGILFQADDLVLRAEPTADVTLGGSTFTPEETGTLRAELDHPRSLAPFAMIGFGRHGTPGFGFFLDLGLAFLGDPEIGLSANGTLAGEPTLEDALRAEEEELAEEVDPYDRFYPIVSVGVRIGFGG